MKKLIILTGVLIVMSLSSCVKDYTCTCTDSTGNKVDVQNYPRTGLVDAQKACKDRQSFWQNTTVPSAQCKIL